MAKLSDIPKQNSFEVPENYFENFAVNVQQRIQTEEKPKGKTVWLHQLKPYLSVAALFVFAFSLWYAYAQFATQEQSLVAETELSAEDYYLYALDQSSMIDYSTLETEVALEADETDPISYYLSEEMAYSSLLIEGY